MSAKRSSIRQAAVFGRDPVRIATAATFTVLVALLIAVDVSAAQDGLNESLLTTVLDVGVGLAFILGAVVAPSPRDARLLFGLVGVLWMASGATPGDGLAYL